MCQAPREEYQALVKKAVERVLPRIQGYRLGLYYKIRSLPPAEAFRHILTKDIDERKDDDLAELVNLTRGVKFFQKFHVPDNERKLVCRKLEFLELEAHDYVFRQGESGNKFYIILSGSVAVSIFDPAREMFQVVNTLSVCN